MLKGKGELIGVGLDGKWERVRCEMKLEKGVGGWIGVEMGYVV